MPSSPSFISQESLVISFRLMPEVCIVGKTVMASECGLNLEELVRRIIRPLAAGVT